MPRWPTAEGTTLWQGADSMSLSRYLQTKTNISDIQTKNNYITLTVNNCNLHADACHKGSAALDVNRRGVNSCCKCTSCTFVTTFERMSINSKNVVTTALALYLRLGITIATATPLSRRRCLGEHVPHTPIEGYMVHENENDPTLHRQK